MNHRTCVVCRKSLGKIDSRLRFISLETNQKLSVDILETEAGRGAYCCVELNCIGNPELGLRLIASLKGESVKKLKKSLEVSSLREELTEQLLNSFANLEVNGQRTSKIAFSAVEKLEKIKAYLT